MPYEVNDISFLGVEHPDYGPGFDLWVGGGLSTNPMLAQRLGVWVPLDEVPDVWAGVVGIFRDYGYRRLRHRARLKFLVADWGVEKFREVLEKEYLGRSLVDGPAPDAAGRSRSTTSACTSSGTGASTSAPRRSPAGSPAPSWRSSPTSSRRTAATGCASRRTRSCSSSTSTSDRTESLVRGAARRSAWRRSPSAWRRGTMACTGIEFCKLAIVETKARGEELVARLEERLRRLRRRHLDPHQRLPERLRPHPGRRHRPQGPAGAGPGRRAWSRASRSTSAAGSAWPQGQTAGFGRKLRGLKTTAEELPAYVERLARRYLAGRTEGEAFAQWVVRAEEAELR